MLRLCAPKISRVSGHRCISTIRNTHKHLTRRIIVQHYTKPQPSTNAKSVYVPGGRNSFSNSSPSLQAGLSQQRRAREPTLGFEALDNTKITNPIKAENGDILKVKITQRASQKLNAINEQDKKPDQALRVLVESGGCHGYQYVLGLKDLDTIDATEDSIFELDGAKFVVDATSLEILRDSTIDYTSELIGSQFKVVNSPYATSSCGCGSSFDFDPTAMAK